MKLPKSAYFIDWGKQRIPYRLNLDLESGEWKCAIDPHGRDEWNVFGSAPTMSDAVVLARVHWNEYDRQP